MDSEVRSVKCGMRSVKCDERVEWEVWRGECEVWSGECEVTRLLGRRFNCERLWWKKSHRIWSTGRVSMEFWVWSVERALTHRCSTVCALHFKCFSLLIDAILKNAFGFVVSIRFLDGFSLPRNH